MPENFSPFSPMTKGEANIGDSVSETESNERRYEGPSELIKLKIGGISIEEYKAKIEQANSQLDDENEKMKINDWAKQMMQQVETAQEEREIELVRLSVADLGFTESAKYEELCAKAGELGLEMCPAVVGPALRLQLKEQPMDDRIIVAMEPLVDSAGSPLIFGVDRTKDGRWLFASEGYPDDKWKTQDSFVFVRGKQ